MGGRGLGETVRHGREYLRLANAAAAPTPSESLRLASTTAAPTPSILSRATATTTPWRWIPSRSVRDTAPPADPPVAAPDPVYDCDGNNVHDMPPGYYNCSVRELRARIEASRLQADTARRLGQREPPAASETLQPPADPPVAAPAGLAVVLADALSDIPDMKVAAPSLAGLAVVLAKAPAPSKTLRRRISGKQKPHKCFKRAPPRRAQVCRRRKTAIF